MKNVVLAAVLVATSSGVFADNKEHSYKDTLILGHICNQSGSYGSNSCEVNIENLNSDLYINGDNINLETLKGADGSDGINGVDGIDGEQGIQGEKGDAFLYEDFTEEQLASFVGGLGATGASGKDADMSIVNNNTKNIVKNSATIKQETVAREKAVASLGARLNTEQGQRIASDRKLSQAISGNSVAISNNRSMIGDLYSKSERNRQDIKELRSGVAMSMAATSLIQATNGGSVVSVAAGNYDGSNAFALGASTNFGEKNEYTTKASVMSTSDEQGCSVGAGYHF